MTIVSISINAWIDVYYVKSGKRFCNVKIYYKNQQPFTSDSLNYYIGNTHNYLFIYHQKDDITTVEKMDEVKVIEFPKKKNFSDK